ncbi:MAG TPA: hypothetical protein VF199_06730 [Bacillales bacterium]
MNNQKGIFCKSMMLGAFIGGIVSLFHKPTRESVRHSAGKAASQTRNFARTVREDPARVRDQFKATSENIRTMVKDINAEARDVMTTFNEVKANSKKTYESVKETRGELKEFGTKLKDSAEEVKEEGSKHRRMNE